MRLLNYQPAFFLDRFPDVKQLTCSVFFFTLLFNLYSQVTVTVRINSGSSTTTCTDFPGSPEPQWRVNVNSQGWTTYPGAGICFTNPPNTQYTQIYHCPSTYPATVNVCLRAFEDDGSACVVSESCMTQACNNFAVPAPGGSITYNLNVGGASTATINFTVQATGSFLPLAGTDNRVVCNPFTWINGVTYTSNNNTATHTIVGGSIRGCDSLVTLNATFNSVTDNSTSTSGVSITANNVLASYVWLDCNNSFSVIPGQTAQSFPIVANGSYAVQLTQNGCIDTSNCVPIIGLPVEMLHQHTTCKNGLAYINWATSSEVNNSHFIVEKSFDGIVWEWVSTINGAGNSNVIQHYDAVDNRLMHGISYYRLIQVDNDGKMTKFDPMSINHCNVKNGLNVYPNPTSDKFYIYGYELVYLSQLNIYNVAGKCVRTEKINSENQYIEAPVEPGTYFIELVSGDQRYWQKLIRR